MPKPIAPELREAIVASIKNAQATGKSAGQIAREHGVARSTVTKIADQAGLSAAFERTQTAKAARAKQVDNAAKRARLQSDLLDDAQKFRARAWSPYKVAVMGPDGAETVTLPLPPLPDAARAYTAIGIIIDKDRAYERDKDGANGTEQARSLLGRMITGLAAIVDGERPTPDDEG
jgi:transposase-like protein